MRLRRKNDETVLEVDDTDVDPLVEQLEGEGPATAGPVDFEDLDPDAVFIDLGSLLIQPPEGLELRLQVEEDTGEVLAVLLVAEEGVLEARAFASSRGGDLWTDVRREIAADSVQRGGTAAEQDGPFGPELFCEVPVTGPDGEEFVQPSRVIGWSGSRWFLRATIAGRPAQDADYALVFEDAFRRLAVRRGNEAMAPGEPLPLRLPPEAQLQDEPDPDGSDTPAGNAN